MLQAKAGWMLTSRGKCWRVGDRRFALMKKYLKLSCLGCSGLIVILLVIGVIVSMFEDEDDSIGGSVPTASRETPKVSQNARPSQTPTPRPTPNRNASPSRERLNFTLKGDFRAQIQNNQMVAMSQITPCMHH